MKMRHNTKEDTKLRWKYKDVLKGRWQAEFSDGLRFLLPGVHTQCGPLPLSAGRMWVQLDVTPMISLYCMSKAKEFCGYKLVFKSADPELIQREIIWVAWINWMRTSERGLWPFWSDSTPEPKEAGSTDVRRCILTTGMWTRRGPQHQTGPCPGWHLTAASREPGWSQPQNPAQLELWEAKSFWL